MRSFSSPVRFAALGPLVGRIRAVAQSPEMLAIQRALPISFGGLALGLGVFMLTSSGTFLLRFQHSFGPSFGVMSALLVVVLAFDLARRRSVPRAIAVPVATLAFVLALPLRGATSPYDLARTVSSSGLFLALGIALLTVTVLALGRRTLGRTFGLAAASFAIVASAFALLASGVSLTAGLNVLLAPLGDLGDSLTALLIITFVETALWLIGIHGPALLAAVVLPVYMNLQTQNTEALSHGDPLRHIVTVSTFLFVFPGGAGATLPLVILLLRSKVKRLRTIAYATFLPSLANVNEPLIFGLPLVLNPTLAVPFVLAPLALAVVTWEAMNLHLVALPAYWIPSTVPLPINVFLATKDWRSVALVFIDLALGLAIYAPFVAAYERQQLAHQSDHSPA